MSSKANQLTSFVAQNTDRKQLYRSLSESHVHRNPNMGHAQGRLHLANSSSVVLNSEEATTVGDVGLQRPRLRIYYQDDSIKECSDLATRSTLCLKQTSTNAKLCQKALKYRRVLDKLPAQTVDYANPALDVFECLGVEWCKVSRSKSY